MKKRYKKIAYEDEKNITLKTPKGAKGNFFTKILKLIHKCCSSYNHANPIIIDGYRYVCGDWYNGYVIERESDGSQFVWVPVAFLENDGTLDGEHFTEKFGRRKFYRDEFSKNKFHEKFTEELKMQRESVIKYGGFYISRYNISKNANTGKPQSVKNAIPWVNVSFFEAKEIAGSFENQSEEIKSHLPYGAEHDSVITWFVKSGARNFNDLDKGSAEWENYFNIKNSKIRIAKTGSRKKWCLNNIYDFTYNVSEWTQEEHGVNNRVIRGAGYGFRGFDIPILPYEDTGFRVALFIK